ncbi:MAG: 50S ribosomal protein L18 [Kiritimatiellia bacterium]|jgi:large subunit ribosomal protein L18
MSARNRIEQRRLRHRRIRQRVKGTAARPRMAIYVSNKHLYVQFIDDDASTTLAAACSGKELPGCNIEVAKAVGENAAKAALEKGIQTVVVDRGGFLFHGRVKQIVDAAVAAGLKVSAAAKADDATEEVK